jgi:hypothetical protein
VYAILWVVLSNSIYAIVIEEMSMIVLFSDSYDLMQTSFSVFFPFLLSQFLVCCQFGNPGNGVCDGWFHSSSASHGFDVVEFV